MLYDFSHWFEQIFQTAIQIFIFAMENKQTKHILIWTKPCQSRKARLVEIFRFCMIFSFHNYDTFYLVIQYIYIYIYI